MIGSTEQITRNWSEWDLTDSRDELNFAEFPLSCVADRAPRGVKTLVFEDEIWDAGRNEKVARRLTVAGSDDYGLPTALDEDVLVFLMKLTKQVNGFTNPRVYFSRYQLIQLLGWDDGGKSYKRLDESLQRWAGVTLRYKRAWWDKRGQRWKDQAFHVLESVELCGREFGGDQLNLPLSNFTWNGILFSSFQAGYMKRLDLEVYKRLKLAGSRRAYRFLDKRFYHKPRWEFPLREFACGHIGLSSSYDNGNIKRKLRDVVEELVGEGFIELLDDKEMFVRVGHGDWRIVFQQKTSEATAEKIEGSHSPASSMLTELVSRGVSPKVAAELSSEFPAERVQEKVELHDWLLSKNDSRMGDNPAGYLVMAIKEDYSLPKGFQSKAMREAKAQRKMAVAKKKRNEQEAERLRVKQEREESEAREQFVEQHLALLSEAEQEALVKEALQVASSEDRKFYENARKLRVEGMTREARNRVVFAYLQKQAAAC